MTITTNPARDEYTATAGQTVFNYTFKIYESDNLDVYLTPVGQSPDDSTGLTIDYVVDPNTIGDEDGGFITFNSPLSAGVAVTIVSGIPLDRTVDYQNNGDFRPTTVNGDNDRQVSQIKQIADLSNRTLQFPVSAQNKAALTLPNPVAGNFVRWKGDLTGMENVEFISGTTAGGQLLIFPNVGAMVASTDVNLVAGMNVVTQGYYNPNDGGGAKYVVETSATPDEQGRAFTLTNGLFAVLAPATPIIAAQFGAVDGAGSDSKAVIDLLNVEGTTVELSGFDVRYDGDFTQMASFRNGVISANQGGYPYTDNVIIDQLTVTVGAAGTFKRLDAALDWLKSQTINNLVTLSVLDKFATKDASDPMALNNYLFDHPQSFNVELVGDSLVGAVPTNADMVDNEATDEALALSRYSASIYLPGAGISGSYGLAAPNGLKAIRRIMFVSDTRYSVDIGFNGSHFQSTKTRGCIFDEFTIFGGVWGVIGKGAQLVFPSDSFFAYQFSGGPIDSIGCVVRADVANMNMYASGGVQPSTGPQYGIFAEEGSRLYMPFNNAETLRIQGSFLHGIFISDESLLTGVDIYFTGVTQPMTATTGSTIKIETPVISNADPANTAAVAGAAQSGYGNNVYQGALICAGFDGYIDIVSGSVTNCIAAYCGVAAGGKLVIGYTPLNVTSCLFTTMAFQYDLSEKCLLAANIITPQGGSVNEGSATNQSQVRASSFSGFNALTPTQDTTVNGNLFSTSS
ncbi:hypothetical protein N9878_00890 [bacterium]|nr:hypothetical protein [bacterium]